MIFAQENTAFTATLWNEDTGLVGTLSVGIFDPAAASFVVGPNTVGITETPAGSGVYLANLTCPPVLMNAATYLVIWNDPTIQDVVEELRPLAGPSPESVTMLPNIDDVGALLRARTKDVNGVELGTFNADTRPTDTSVVQMMTNASDEVYAEMGTFDNMPAVVQNMARRLIAIRTAMLIEMSYFPEQVKGDKSAYTNLADMYEKSLPRLKEAAREIRQSGESFAGDGMLPKFDFPQDTGGMISHGTRW